MSLARAAEVSHVIMDKSGRSVGIIAAQFGHYECVKGLIGMRIKLKETDNKGWTCLLHVAWWGKTECAVKLVKELGVNVRHRDREGRDVVQLAQEKREPECASMLRAMIG